MADLEQLDGRGDTLGEPQHNVSTTVRRKQKYTSLPTCVSHCASLRQRLARSECAKQPHGGPHQGPHATAIVYAARNPIAHAAPPLSNRNGDVRHRSPLGAGPKSPISRSSAHKRNARRSPRGRNPVFWDPLLPSKWHQNGRLQTRQEGQCKRTLSTARTNACRRSSPSDRPRRGAESALRRPVVESVM
ncbi:hypothetical protein DENSPDRAFT_579608 [Dentipellis sp. KUC8613]|nr:hypothetical protein DENSPDRAFT_579608 [Dentipellis sp. KUC8613]